MEAALQSLPRALATSVFRCLIYPLLSESRSSKAVSELLFGKRRNPSATQQRAQDLAEAARQAKLKKQQSSSAKALAKPKVYTNDEIPESKGAPETQTESNDLWGWRSSQFWQDYRCGKEFRDRNSQPFAVLHPAPRRFGSGLVGAQHL